MSEMWKASGDVYRSMESLIANNQCLSNLALVDDEILIVFKEKASKTGDQVVMGKTSKANQILSIVDPEQKEWKFIITLAGDAWGDLSDKEREALLFHHLCACGVEENPQTGKMRWFVKLPDVAFFREEIEKYGAWRTSGHTIEPGLIDELFGPKAGTANGPGPSVPKAQPKATAATAATP